MARTVSHHMLRRRARDLKHELEDAQARAARDPLESDRAAWIVLRSHDIKPSDHLAIEPTKRGPWRWRIVAT